MGAFVVFFIVRMEKKSVPGTREKSIIKIGIELIWFL